MKKMIESNYFIAIVVPKDVEERVDRERLEISRRWHCKSGMRTKAHITLIPPFFSDKTMDELLSLFTTESFSSFDLTLSSYGSFSLRTIFVNVLYSKKCRLMRDQIGAILSNNGIAIKEEQRFKPHLTIANRDIKSEDFVPIMEYLKQNKIKKTIKVSSFVIFERKDYLWLYDEKNVVRFSF